MKTSNSHIIFSAKKKISRVLWKKRETFGYKLVASRNFFTKIAYFRLDLIEVINNSPTTQYY